MNFKTILLFGFLWNSVQAQDTLPVNVDSLIMTINANQIQYNTLSQRAVLTWDDGNTAQQFNAAIRVKHDSLIWMSLGIMGIEGARLLITTDSFHLLNKLTNEYISGNETYIRNWTFLPVNFSMLQQIISGEKISIGEKISAAMLEEGNYLLYLESDKMLEKIWISPENYTLQKILLKDKLLKQDMLITFDSYNSLNGKLFSYKRSIVINRDTAAIHLDMDIKKVQTNIEPEFPFTVSEKFKRAE